MSDCILNGNGFSSGYKAGYASGTNINNIVRAQYGKVEKSSDSGGRGSQTYTWSLATGTYIAILSQALNYGDTADGSLSISGTNVTNLTQVSVLNQKWVDKWATATQIVYKFKTTSTGNVTFTCSAARSDMDHVLILSVIKVN